MPDRPWQTTAALRERAVRDDLVAATAVWMGVAETRVAAPTLFFGYAARLWSVAVGSVVVAGCCVSLDIEELLWSSESGALSLHLEHPRFGGPADAEVLDGQLAPLIAALDPASGRRRSCCLFYRTGSGGVCDDCPFPTAPLVKEHSGPEIRS